MLRPPTVCAMASNRIEYSFHANTRLSPHSLIICARKLARETALVRASARSNIFKLSRNLMRRTQNLSPLNPRACGNICAEKRICARVYIYYVPYAFTEMCYFVFPVHFLSLIEYFGTNSGRVVVVGGRVSIFRRIFPVCYAEVRMMFNNTPSETPPLARRRRKASRLSLCSENEREKVLLDTSDTLCCCLLFTEVNCNSATSA